MFKAMCKKKIIQSKKLLNIKDNIGEKHQGNLVNYENTKSMNNRYLRSKPDKVPKIFLTKL